MSSRGTRKRARTGSIAATSTDGRAQDSMNVETSPRKRDEESWYSDGNIILVARDIEFCVFKGILAKHSPVFSDMLSFPQPPVAGSSDPSPVQDDLPVVHLSDSPEDLRHILRAYMPTGGPSTFFQTRYKYSYYAISAAIRLGHKYQMTDLLDDALGYLKTYYPTEFDKWRAYDNYGPPGFSEQHTIGVVNLARLAGENGLLLMALLVCCTIPNVGDLVRGVEREDGSREQLTLDDIALCYHAKTLLMDWSVKITLAICRQEVSAGCKTGQSCLQALAQVLNGLEAAGNFLTYPDPSVDGIGLNDAIKAVNLCLHCRAMVKERDTREREMVWGQLQGIFDIYLEKPANEEG
ncbi:uncharacterized protein TRAVEDRAFT_49741 [Trametes versicolor FP-101664 SS1]|uniref:uncharacterized protein n=1 Tax=Trametes versicolor (strain FP-101664) TaxID=717944 RepID=UPI000462490F|nr:uncharacterized protein TRAVEDRAFT_49741 [Trametes versicolor FP-101664 SS1]EIW56930.1 hypothetical protein TRAVEDRAFT_49741 [Trametes versicolor FP-101664 SS1]